MITLFDDNFPIFGKFSDFLKSCDLKLDTWDTDYMWHLRHWLHCWQLRTTLLRITLWPLYKVWQGQHSQFLRCFTQKDNITKIQPSNQNRAEFKLTELSFAKRCGQPLLIYPKESLEFWWKYSLLEFSNFSPLPWSLVKLHHLHQNLWKWAKANEPTY